MSDKNTIDQLAKIIWEYHQMHLPLKKADAIFVLGSNDLRVAEYAAELYLKGYAPRMLFSGGIAHSADLLSTGWDKSEAEVMAEVAISKGVPSEIILLETQATNTGENISLTRKLLEDNGLSLTTFLLVQKPYMERRAFATFSKQWPEKEFSVTSPRLTYEEYMGGDIPKDVIINIMVGDLERIKEYPVLGFQIFQEVPVEAENAFTELVKMGFDSHLIKK